MKPPADPITGRSTLKSAPAPFVPPYDEDEDGNLLRQPEAAVARTAALATAPLDDQLLADAADMDLLPPEQLAAHDQTSADRKAQRLTKAQKRALKLTQEALALRAQGFDIGEIAGHLGVAPSTVVGYFARHRHALAETAIDDLLDQTAVPIAAENLIHGLLAGDKEYTLETLKGRGAFRRYSAGDHSGAGSEIPALVVRVENADGSAITAALGSAPPKESAAAGGRIVGQPALPKQIEGTVVAKEIGD